MTTGLVIGKFFPPHRGHSFLIETALGQVDELDVIVCDHPSQDIRGEIRAQWLREMQPAARVIVVDDFGDDDNSEAWAEFTIRTLGRSPDMVFTSESYGLRYAKLMGSRHVSVDPAREEVPISATQIRENPFANWDFLAPCVRAHYVRRVVVVGAESTGTTTLARALAQHYATLWVPEYGREYSEAKMAEGTFSEDQWSSDDFVAIARHQQQMEDEAARDSGPYLICDTDALATTIWHERYMGTASPEVRALADSRRYALYVLTSDDIPFVQDGLRDGEHLRSWMTERFREELGKRDEPWLEVRGTHAERMGAAVSAIDALEARV